MKIKILSILALLLTVTQGAWAEGELNGLFTINASGDKVQFSQGNLQYFCSTSAPEWRFAEHQYDYVAFDGSAYAENSEKWIDLFGYGTSGYNNGQTCYQPYSTPENSSYYYTNNLTGNADWGYNAISNGGNTENSGWRTLTKDEWVYLFSGRSNAKSKYGQACINGVNGMILLPDSWTLPDGLSFTSGQTAWTNSYTLEQWSLMENAGAVFLPASGSRNGNSLPTTANDNGLYRSSTAAFYLCFKKDLLQECTVSFSQYGDAVRLVKDYYEVTLTDGNNLSALLPYAGKTCTVTYTRSFTASKPSTVCLPFAYTPQGEEKFYSFTGINEDGGNYTADMTEVVSPLVANTPYLFMPTGDADFSGTYAIPASITAGSTTSGAWTFIGTYSTIEWTSAPTEPTYGFSAQAANDGITQGQFVKVGSYVRIKPMRAYLQYNGSDSQFANARSLTRAAATTSDDTLPETIGVRLISANGEVTAIGTLEVSFDSEAWYTLDGKRLNAKPNTKGIYVNNGKKVVIK